MLIFDAGDLRTQYAGWIGRDHIVERRGHYAIAHFESAEAIMRLRTSKFWELLPGRLL